MPLWIIETNLSQLTTGSYMNCLVQAGFVVLYLAVPPEQPITIPAYHVQWFITINQEKFGLTRNLRTLN